MLQTYQTHYRKTGMSCPCCQGELEESVTYEYDYEVPIYWCETCGKSFDPDSVYNDEPLTTMDDEK